MQLKFLQSVLRFQQEYFIFLLPLFFVLHGYTNHYSDVPTIDAIFLTIRYIAVAVVMNLVLALIFRSSRKGAIFTVVSLGFYFFFGAVHDWLKDNIGESLVVSYRFILPFAVVTFFLLGIYLARTNRSFNQLQRYLNILLLVLIMIDGVLLTVKSAEAVPVRSRSSPVLSNPVVQESACDTCTDEDIHLIVADEYAGSNALQAVFQFDNTPFEDSLRSRGFTLVKNSFSNYNFTVVSMASLFQMDYIEDINGKQEDEIYYFSKSIINKNDFLDFITAKGYIIRNFSFFQFAHQPPFAESYFPQRLQLITGNTFLSRVKKDLGYHASMTFKIDSEVRKLEKQLKYEGQAESRKMDSVLKEVAHQGTAPRFFYTHLLMPHAPYHFDVDGKLLRLESYLQSGSKQDENKLYLAYLQYCNKTLLSFIDGIKKLSRKPPIILFMSDHGFRGKNVAKPYHFSTINAVFLPNGNDGIFYSGMSNVNQLRALLNTKFSTHLPMLNDSCSFLQGENTRH
jgi:hypothetical protein